MAHSPMQLSEDGEVTLRAPTPPVTRRNVTGTHRAQPISEEVDMIGQGHYSILEVPQDATAEAITAAYEGSRAKAKTTAPSYDEPTVREKDLRDARLHNLGKAFEILTDGRKRLEYDRWLHAVWIQTMTKKKASGSTAKTENKQLDEDGSASGLEDGEDVVDIRGRGPIESQTQPKAVRTDTWIAQRDGRDWDPPKKRRRSPTYEPYHARAEASEAERMHRDHQGQHRGAYRPGPVRHSATGHDSERRRDARRDELPGTSTQQQGHSNEAEVFQDFLNAARRWSGRR